MWVKRKRSIRGIFSKSLTCDKCKKSIAIGEVYWSKSSNNALLRARVHNRNWGKRVMHYCDACYQALWAEL